MRLQTLFRAGAWGAILWRFFGPDVPPRYTGVQTRPQITPGRSVLAAGREHFVREVGDPHAPPVVLLHGWVYDGLATWHRVVGELAQSHRLIIPDLRNHGKAERPREPFEISDLADDVAAVMDAVEAPRAAVVGYSMGGMVAQELARRHPHRVERLVLAGTAARPMPLPGWVMVPFFIVARASARLFPSVWPRVVHRVLLRLEVFERSHSRWLWEQVRNRDVELYYQAGFAIRRFDSRSWVGRLDVPTMVVIPTADRLVPPRAQYEMAALIGDAEVVELPGAGHEAIMSDTADLAKALVGFLSVTAPG